MMKKSPDEGKMTGTCRSRAEAEAERIEEPWGSLNWLANDALGNSANLTLGRVIIKKGHSSPRHSHPNCDEVLYLLKGKLKHIVGNQTFVVEPGDTTVAPANTAHITLNIGDEDADFILAYSSGDRRFREES